MFKISILMILLAVVSPLFAEGQYEADVSSYEFTNESKEATEFTAEANAELYDILDFEDRTAFENADRGFIAPLINDGNIDGIYFNSGVQFMMDKEAPAEVNPSLWRHAQLVNRGGLYEVMEDKIYQVRGQDVNTLTIIETENGIILYDLCLVPETFIQAYQLYEQERGRRDLKAVIISHNHTDHYGGISGIIDLGLATQEQFDSAEIPVYVPEHFQRELVSESVLYGNIMSRRALYQYGYGLAFSPRGIITAALGPLTPAGQNAMPSSVVEITEDNLNITVDGLDIEFMLVPESEAPAEMVFYIPEWKALTMAEVVNQLQHNVYTLRGAPIRDANKWAQYIHDAIIRWGDDVEIHFGPHTWPEWGNENVNNYLKAQRDIYRAIFDQTTRLANYGYRPYEIVERIDIPEPIMNNFANRGYYGQFENNVYATYVNNIGWFNANPTELARHTDAESGRRYVEAFGGEEVVIAKALEYFKDGDYKFTVELLNHIISYNGENKKANYLAADAFEQIGYQEESALARNWFLMAALELRRDDNVPMIVNSAGPGVLNAIPAELMPTVLSTQVDPRKGLEAGELKLTLILNGTSLDLIAENGVLNGAVSKGVLETDVTVETNNVAFFALLTGAVDLETVEKAGMIEIDGDVSVFEKFLGIIDTEIPNNYNLVKPRYISE
ncbi:MAG: alkyl sulfatase dimerization domain-containing protein [Spirochaetales bacterium]|nr:alkyl sulfatase dimerization domain-containing protein [Spirochaetales bacterium]